MQDVKPDFDDFGQHAYQKRKIWIIHSKARFNESGMHYFLLYTEQVRDFNNYCNLSPSTLYFFAIYQMNISLLFIDKDIYLRG